MPSAGLDRTFRRCQNSSWELLFSGVYLEKLKSGEEGRENQTGEIREDSGVKWRKKREKGGKGRRDSEACGTRGSSGSKAGLTT